MNIKLCICGCGRRAAARGLAMSCYSRYRERVLKKKTTWEDLVKEGKCLEVADLREYRKNYSRALWGHKGLPLENAV